MHFSLLISLDKGCYVDQEDGTAGAHGRLHDISSLWYQPGVKTVTEVTQEVTDITVRYAVKEL